VNPTSPNSSRNNRRGLRLPLDALAGLALISLIAPGALLRAQDNRGEEVVANLSEGRVIFCVTKDGMLVGSAEGGGEKGSRPPAIVPIGGGRIGVLLGATEWISGGKTLRLDGELATVAANAVPHGTVPGAVEPNQTTAIEDIGIGMLELMRPQVTEIHRKLDLGPDEPLVELLLADYVQGYGPEVWSLQYRIRQEDLGNNYWETRPLRPAYYQLYPPEKGQPRTFMEIRYPANSTQPELIAQLQAHDPSLDPIANASPEISKSIAAILAGDSRKALLDPVSDFLRAALPVLAGSKARISLAKLDPDHGFQWILAPAEPPPTPTQTKPREPDAPSLRKYSQPN
jgi:hypothetical protein